MESNLPSRHIPFRSCIACGIKVDKRQLVRLVRSQDGSVLIDYLHIKTGRGAYLCSNSSCWEVALGRNAIEYHLKVSHSAADMVRKEFSKVLLESN